LVIQLWAEAYFFLSYLTKNENGMIESNTLIGVLIGFTVLGILLGRMTSKDSVDDFALGGRSLGFFPSLMTLSGTFVSAVTLMVYTSFVYIYGISAAWIFIGYTLGFLLFIPFALKLYRLSIKHKFFTLTDYFVFRYGRKTARWVIGVIFVWYVGLLSTQLLVGSNLLNELGGIPVNWAKLGMLLSVMVYLLVGGFGSVVKTDMFQFLVIFLVLILVTLTLNKGGEVPPEMYAPFNAGPVNIVAFLLLGYSHTFCHSGLLAEGLFYEKRKSSKAKLWRWGRGEHPVDGCAHLCWTYRTCPIPCRCGRY
jgi:Na+/proline symporter